METRIICRNWTNSIVHYAIFSVILYTFFSQFQMVSSIVIGWLIRNVHLTHGLVGLPRNLDMCLSVSTCTWGRCSKGVVSEAFCGACSADGGSVFFHQLLELRHCTCTPTLLVTPVGLCSCQVLCLHLLGSDSLSLRERELHGFSHVSVTVPQQ